MKLAMTPAQLIRRTQKKEKPGQMALPQNKDLPNHGLEHRMMLSFEIPLVQSVRKCSSQRGPRTYKIGSGKMLSRLRIEYIMLAVMLKSPWMDQHLEVLHHKHELVHLILSLVSERLKVMTLRGIICVLRWNLHDICHIINEYIIIFNINISISINININSNQINYKVINIKYQQIQHEEVLRRRIMTLLCPARRISAFPHVSSYKFDLFSSSSLLFIASKTQRIFSSIYQKLISKMAHTTRWGIMGMSLTK